MYENCCLLVEEKRREGTAQAKEPRVGKEHTRVKVWNNTLEPTRIHCSHCPRDVGYAGGDQGERAVVQRQRSVFDEVVLPRHHHTVPEAVHSQWP